MGLMIPAYRKTDSVQETAGNAAESTPRKQLTEAGGTNLTSGVLKGLHITQDDAVAADTITLRIYSALTDGIELYSADFTFAALDDFLSDTDLEIPFFAGLWFTLEAAAGAGRTATLTPIIQPIGARVP